jgi:hypothetical protein
MWRIGIALDKFYPGNVYGIYVDIWADTKEVRHIKEVFSTLDPPEDQVVTLSECAIPLNSQTTDTTETLSLPLLVGLVLAVAMVSSVPVLALKKTGHITKQHSFKCVSLVLCLLLVSTMFMSLATVSTTDPRKRSTVWGSESTGDSSRKTQAEIDQQRLISQYISDYFKNDGYAAINEQGNKGSYKSQILNRISDNHANYDRSAVIDFNHGVGNYLTFNGVNEFHYMFEDNVGTLGSGTITGNGVYDYEIFPQTANGKAFFTFISTCLSASIDTSNTMSPQLNPEQGMLYDAQGQFTGRIRGMPYAWTHKLVTSSPTTNPPSGYMSSNGYSHPDSGAHCYMGFSFGSAALCQQVDNNYPNVYYWQWLQDFLYYALSLDITINQALDRASQNRFNAAFSGTALCNSFTAIWPGFQQFANCKLVVYGNGNLRLYEYFVHSYVGSSSYLSGLVSIPNGFTGAQPDGSYTRLRAVNVNDQAMITGSMGYSGADQARGRIWIYGYASSYTSRLRVYVSNDNSNWYLANNNVIISPGGARWIDCGTYANNFKYISLTVYRENSNDYSSDIYIDNVIVLPPLPNP